MKKWLNMRNLCSLCLSVLVAAELLLLIDGAVVLWGGALSIPIAAVLLAALTLLSCLLFRGEKKRILAAAVRIPVVVGIVAAACFACWNQFRAGAAYQDPDAGKNKIYGDRRVMLIVPHQDDDINILGGVMEEYARYGSEVYAVFVTNGDYSNLAETRYREALDVFGGMGVPEEQVIFLGYGDGWQTEGPHIYNAESGRVMESYAGRTETYGTKYHTAYREGREYTIDNLTEDLKAVILEYRPDVIFCSDYDHHIDHKATTLLFDKVMGLLLKEEPEYDPIVYKAFAYGTAWEAEPDYYAENILSTKNLFEEPYFQQPAVYRWEDRVRFPVSGSLLSRSLLGSEGFAVLNSYKSQGAGAMAAAVINGDKVAWQRCTTSLCLDADISVTSGQAELLNDFMLIENHDLADESRLPYDGVWIPASDDGEKTAAITLKEQSAVFSVVLYDHPSEEHNIRNAVITFDDGTSVETGPLDPGGAATSIRVNKEQISAFSVAVTETEGELAGLSEIEAFAEEPGQDGRFIKLMDEDENFLYDYWTAEDGTVVLSLYRHGDLPALEEEHYMISTDSEAGSAVLENGVIRVNCPVGESFVLNVTCNSAGLSDSVLISNPGKPERIWSGLCQDAEKAVFTHFVGNGRKNLLVFSIPKKISHVIRHLM